MKLLLFFVLTFFCYNIHSTYQVSSFADYGNFGPGFNVEGLYMDSQYMYVTLFFQGIDKINQAGDITSLARFQTQFPAPAITAIKKRANDELIVAVHEVNPFTQLTTEFNGVWSVPLNQGFVTCDFSPNSSCEKLFPLNNEPIFYPDGIAVDGFDIYVSDPALGNIWRYLESDQSFELWAGTDVGDFPNFLEGIPSISPINPVGKGFGVNGLVIDRAGKTIYGANSNLAAVISIPILKNGSAGIQTIVGGQTFTAQYFFDGIHLNKKNIYVTAAARFTQFGLESGRTILSADLKDTIVAFTPIVIDNLLDSPTDVFSSCSFSSETTCDDLYITVIGFFNASSTGVYLATKN